MSVPATTRRPALTVFLCLLVAIFEGVDLQAAGLAVPQLRLEFALTASQIGYFTAASSVGLLLGAIAGGRVADLLGRRSTLITAVSIFGVFSIATAWSNGFEVLVVTRFMTGVGLGGALPNLIALASENSAPTWRSRAVALMYIGFPLGGALSSWIMSGLATSGSATNALVASLGLVPGDWRIIFYFGGVAPLAAVPLVWLLLPDSAEFKELKRSTGAAVGAAAEVPGMWNVVFGGGRALNSVLLWASFFLTLLVVYLLLNWLPALLASRGFPRNETFLVQLAFNGGGVPGCIIVGALMDGAKRKLVVPFVYLGAVISLAFLALMPTDTTIAILIGALVGAFVLGTQALLYGVAPLPYHTAIRGTGVGIAVCMGRIGSVVGPLLAASLVGSGQSATQVLMAIVPLAVIGGFTAVALVSRLKG